METPGTKLNMGWRYMDAPEIAKTYWRLPDDATMLEVIKQVAVDETNHRDVNHTFASMDPKDPNPYVHKHSKAQAASIAYWQQIEEHVEGRDVDYLMNPKTDARPGA